MEKERSERQEEKQEESGVEEVREGRFGGSTPSSGSAVANALCDSAGVRGEEQRRRV